MPKSLFILSLSVWFLSGCNSAKKASGLSDAVQPIQAPSSVSVPAATVPAGIPNTNVVSQTSAAPAVVPSPIQSLASTSSALLSVPVSTGTLASVTPVSVPAVSPVPKGTLFDLDSDGTPETELAAITCSADDTRVCLSVLRSTLLAVREIQIHAFSRRRTSAQHGVEINAIGNHTGSELQEVSILFEQGADHRPGLAVVDVDARNVVAITIGPAHGLDPDRARYAYSDLAVNSKAAKAYPFLAPGLEDGPTETITGDNVSGRAVMWGYMCVYGPAFNGSKQGRCGRGFVEIPTAPLDTLNGDHWTREMGAVMADVDGDGQDEIILLFKTAFVIYSAKTAKWIKTVTFDVAAASNPTVRKLFHSGRIRGITSAARVGSKVRFITVSGIPVGETNDYNCAVSRYAMVVEGVAGNPASLGMKWSWYMSFASNTFEGSNVSRQGDFLNKCIHRFGDGRTLVDGEPAVVFNYFEDADKSPKCVEAQRRLNVGGWRQADYDLWVACYSALPAVSKGNWRILGISEDSGAQIFGGSNVYIWGRIDGVSPSGETLYVVEDFIDGGKTPYQFNKVAPAKRLRLLALRNRKFVEVASFPIEGRPKISRRNPGGALGAGSSTYYANLTAADIDGDGRLELQLENGHWLGFDAAGALIVKK